MRSFTNVLFFLLIYSNVSFAGAQKNNCDLPSFVSINKQKSMATTGTEALFVTHSSWHFDPLMLTKDPMNLLVEKIKKQKSSVYYLHDSSNILNPFDGYLYDDCKPTRYLHSDIGFYHLDITSLNKIYVAGGFYELCENNTVRSTLTKWITNAKGKDKTKSFNITQITDAVFAVGQDVRSSDPYDEEYRKVFYNELRSKHSSSSMPLSQILDIIADDELVVDYLDRRLPKLPSSWSYSIKYNSKLFPIREIDGDSNSVVFEFIKSSEL